MMTRMRLYAIVLVLAAMTAAAQAQVQPSARPIDGLAHRILGDRDTLFKFVCQPDTVDYFIIERLNGDTGGIPKRYDQKIRITGNNDNSLAVGLNYYLKHCAGIHVSWLACEPIELPSQFWSPYKPIRKEALVKNRFFLNYCTFGYTMPWWKWEQWERFIDWMALNGITMPLAITGQEAVWYEVWKEFGMTDEEIRGYFSGPAHLPWHRMANLDGFGGPLPMSWIEGQKELQKRIVAREREFNMTPVLPAFAGHVPKRFAEMHPDADIRQLSAWCGFEPTCFLNSSDPLFAKIQKSFLEKQTALFGTDHIYGVDPFNEMDPPSWEPDYLASVARNIYGSLQQCDPAARWLQMTWVFYYKRKSWTPERLRAYLTAVPQDQLVLLDYFCEKTEVWRTTDGFYGQPFIWCYLGNFGGNTMLVGNINELEKKLAAALEEAEPNMTGIGSTLESFDVSPQIYEYLFERAWEKQPDVQQWIDDWCRLRTASVTHEKEWRLLNDSIYKDWSFYGLGTQLVARPSLEGHGTYYTKPYYSYNNDTLKSICKAFVTRFSLYSIGKDSYKYDLINLFSQWMGNRFMDIRNDFTAAYKNRDINEMERQVEIANQLFADVDTLLNTHPSFMLGPWIEMARDWGTTEAEKDYYERQARTLLTIWGGPVLNDYANRMWGGLVGDYYARRWNLFFEAVIQAVKEGKEFDEKAFGEELSKFEQAWTESHTKYPVEPQKKDFKPVKGKVVRAKKLAAPKKKDNNTPDPWWQNDPTYNAAWTIYIRWMKQTK
ncbi:MAG: alpha-N-acetylglucosaminidase [Bacteroidales bacterium]|nr:alpha-N-acetylglucosaminidase [Bacteroidales bacterium]